MLKLMNILYILKDYVLTVKEGRGEYEIFFYWFFNYNFVCFFCLQ